MSTDIQKAANNSLQKQDVKVTTLQVVKAYLNNDETKRRFEEMLGKKTAGFTSSITSLVTGATSFDNVDPKTIMASAFIAASLDLPINPNLGFAYIIPYGSKAQFQMGYKGFVQLALRTGQYKTINTTEVYEGELVDYNRLSGEAKIDQTKKTSDTVVGYAAYFRLVNGFEKSIYMTVEDIEKHAKKYSKSFSNQSGLWKTNFHVMALKTVLKLLLSKYGILSTEMVTAIQSDQATINAKEENGNFTYEYEDNNSDDDFSNANNYENPAYILQKISEITNPVEMEAWETKHKKDIDAIGGKEGDEIQAAIEAKRVLFNQPDAKKKK
jgi:recombination protein RecT